VVGGAAGQLCCSLDAKFRQGFDGVSRPQRVEQAPLHLATTFGGIAAQSSEIKSHRLHGHGSNKKQVH